MKLIVEVPDDFKAGECYDYTNGAKCPFAARGCWAGAKGFEKCPLKEAAPAPIALKDATKEEFVAEWQIRVPCRFCTGEHCEECVWCADPCTDNFQEDKKP